MAKVAETRVRIDGRFVLNSAREGVRTFVAPIVGIVSAVSDVSTPKPPQPPQQRRRA
jgi:hypothetical protein